MLRFREEEDGRGRGEREEGDVCVCAGGSHASGVSIQRTAKQMSEAWVNLSFGRNWDWSGWSASCCHASPTICPTRSGVADERTQRQIITRALNTLTLTQVLRIQFVLKAGAQLQTVCLHTFFWLKRSCFFWPAWL